MGVFPAGSKQHVPPTWQDLMTDPQSPIIDFYPVNFKIDLNGKKYAWQGESLAYCRVRGTELFALILNMAVLLVRE